VYSSWHPLTLSNGCNCADIDLSCIVILSKLLLLVTPHPDGRRGFFGAAAS
jgi:hypothetical protein